MTSGPIQLLNFPDLETAVTGPNFTRITGKLDSAPGQTYSVQLFSNDFCDGSGHGEGQSFIKTLNVETDVSGSCVIEWESPDPIAEGKFITAITIDADGNTSEFSECVLVSSSTVVKVPDLRNQGISGIEELLSMAGLRVGTISSEPNSDVPAGSVIRQNPAFNSDLELKGTVDLVVASSEIVLIQPGWNLISASRSISMDSGVVIPKVPGLGRIWGYQEAQLYRAEDLPPKEGFWIYGISQSHWIIPHQ